MNVLPWRKGATEILLYTRQFDIKCFFTWTSLESTLSQNILKLKLQLIVISIRNSRNSISPPAQYKLRIDYFRMSTSCVCSLGILSVKHLKPCIYHVARTIALLNVQAQKAPRSCESHLRYVTRFIRITSIAWLSHFLIHFWWKTCLQLGSTVVLSSFDVPKHIEHSAASFNVEYVPRLLWLLLRTGTTHFFAIIQEFRLICSQSVNAISVHNVPVSSGRLLVPFIRRLTVWRVSTVSCTVLPTLLLSLLLFLLIARKHVV